MTTGLTAGAAPTDSVRFDLRSREAGKGSALLLLHGFPTDSRVFEAQLAAARRGELKAHLVCPDLPGFGDTPFDEDGAAVPEILDVDALSEAVANLIARRWGVPVVVGGVAIGGYVAIELAAHHPELVRALVLMGTNAAPDSPKMAPQREDVARLALEHGSAAVADLLAAQPLGPRATDEMRSRMHELIAAADPRGIAALVRGLAQRPDPTPALEALRVPLLVLAGTADPFTPIKEARRLTALVPHARLVAVEGAGHVLPLEAPEAVTAALSAFLGGLPA